MQGIIFTGGQGPKVLVVKQLIEQEVKNAFFVAADSGLIAAEEAGIRPDCIIGDMDSVETSRLETYPAECVIRHARDKDYTDTELALQKVLEKGCDEIWIIGGGGGRVDHLFAIRSLFEREFFPSRWLTDSADIRCVNAENRELLTVNREQKTDVSVFPLGGGPWEAKSTGLKWPLEGLPWDRGFFSLSNVAPDGKFTIKAEIGRFFVILPW